MALLRGAATFVPGVMKFACRGSGGTNSARYCYSIWLRHLLHLRQVGLFHRFHTIAELGPGDSLGIGLAAMLTGTDRYFALDALPHARTAANLRTLDRLVELFERAEDIPDTDEFPEIWPPTETRSLPRDLKQSGAGDRINAIRMAIANGSSDSMVIRYFAPWNDASVVQPDSVDLVLSQAVLEHVENIDATYAALFRWLKPGGAMSHQIDFRSHNLTRDWYGHWTLSPWMWRLVKRRRPYLINRLPASAHLRAMRRHGFEVVLKIPQQSRPPDRQQLAAEFRDMSDEDLRTSALYVIATKPPRSSPL